MEQIKWFTLSQKIKFQNSTKLGKVISKPETKMKWNVYSKKSKKKIQLLKKIRTYYVLKTILMAGKIMTKINLNLSRQ